MGVPGLAAEAKAGQPLRPNSFEGVDCLVSEGQGPLHAAWKTMGTPLTVVNSSSVLLAEFAYLVCERLRRQLRCARENGCPPDAQQMASWQLPRLPCA